VFRSAVPVLFGDAFAAGHPTYYIFMHTSIRWSCLLLCASWCSVLPSLSCLVTPLLQASIRVSLRKQGGRGKRGIHNETGSLPQGVVLLKPGGKNESIPRKKCLHLLRDPFSLSPCT